MKAPNPKTQTPENNQAPSSKLVFGVWSFPGFWVLVLGAFSLFAQSLTWDAHPDPVTGYRVHLGVEPGRYVATRDVGTNTSWRLRILAATNYVSVSAYNDAGETWSDDPFVFLRSPVKLPPPLPSVTLKLFLQSSSDGVVFSDTGQSWTTAVPASGAAQYFRTRLEIE